MQVLALINTESGTFRTSGTDAFIAHLENVFEKAGHTLDISMVTGKNLEKALKKAASDKSVDTILAAGGDGTISCAASTCWKSGKTLAVIPGGTMNLFARSLSVPLDVYEAASVLAKGKPGKVDIATANGASFLHQFSVGMQPNLVRKRSNYSYNSRIGKIMAGIRATLDMVSRPPRFRCNYKYKNKSQKRQLSMIAVSNNLHSEGHMPYPDRLDGHILGIYTAGAISSGASAKLVSDLLLGNWSTNPDLGIEDARQVELEFPDHKRQKKALLDGELIPLERHVKVESHKNALNVLLPEAQ